MASKFQATSKKAESPQRKTGSRDSPESGSPARATRPPQTPQWKSGVKDTELDTGKKAQSPRRKPGLADTETDLTRKSQSPQRKTTTKEAEGSVAKKTQSPHRRISSKEADSVSSKKSQSPLRKSSSKEAESTAAKPDVRSKVPSRESETKAEPRERKLRPGTQSPKAQSSQRASSAPGSSKKTKKAPVVSSAARSDPPIVESSQASAPLELSSESVHPSKAPVVCTSSVVTPSNATHHVIQVRPLPHPLTCDAPTPDQAATSSGIDRHAQSDDKKKTAPVVPVEPPCDPPARTSIVTTAAPTTTPDTTTAQALPVRPQTKSSSLHISEIRIELETPAAISEDSDTDSASSDGAGTVKEVEHSASGSQQAWTSKSDSCSQHVFTEPPNKEAVLPRLELPSGQRDRDMFDDVIEEEYEGAEGGEERSGTDKNYSGATVENPMLLTQKLDLSDISKDLSDIKSTSKDSSLLSSPQSPSPSPRLVMRDHSLTSTPIRKRPALHRRSLVRSLNLSQEPAIEDEELSLSSSEFSNSSLDKNRIDELSDDGSVGDTRVKETQEFTDEQPDGRFFLEMPVPINKQLRIVTSVDRALNPRRRSSSLSSKPDRVLCLGRSSSENLEHVVFLDFLKKHGLSAFLGCFPPSMTMADFR